MDMLFPSLTLSFCVFFHPLPERTPFAIGTLSPSHANEVNATTGQTRKFLARLGINAEVACAAGISPQDATVLFQSAEDTLDSLSPSLEACDLATSDARSTLASLRERAASLLDPALEQGIHQAELTLATAVAAQESAWQTAFEATISPLADPQQVLLRTLRINRLVEVPTQYKVIIRSTDEWRTLRKALLHVKSHESCNLEPSAEEVAVISSASSDSTVFAASQRLTVGLSSMRTVWRQFFQP